MRRIEAGIGLNGHEFTDLHNPWEAGLAAAVDLNKGCYIGQEVIARLHTYDKVKQRLVGLCLDGEAPVGSRILDGNRQVGYLSSAAVRPGGECIGLGYVRNACTAPGTRLSMPAAGDPSVNCRVQALPMG